MNTELDSNKCKCLADRRDVIYKKDPDCPFHGWRAAMKDLIEAAQNALFALDSNYEDQDETRLQLLSAIRHAKQVSDRRNVVV
jgi:hypothetical protein